ncbi:ABC transporter ATP-binding protein [Syntrophomonas palmitatica]|uniref:ABC transporter ATP-binding protein n=1 Tax=Syntrophomonas palmitatica TaxID=402877 RepID=UPI0006CF6010|nr:ABC transporter ATP-binding protein [Syntrophomonas palmitatica]
MIALKSISKVYENGSIRVEALKNVELYLTSGEFLAVMGPSGSGKTTLMNIIGCLDRPSSGSYEFDGINIDGLSENDLAAIRNQKIGFVYQTFNLLPRLNALRNVELPLLYAGIPPSERKRRASMALERVGILDHAMHRPNELSGGQRQRVAIARALVNNPPLILADEPTGNLDSRSGLEVMALLQELHARGSTILLVTHDAEIGQHAERIIYFRDGVLIKSETVYEPLKAQQRLTMLDNEEVS